MRGLNRGVLGLLAILISVSCAKEPGDKAAGSEQMVVKKNRIVYYAIPG